MTSLAFPFLCGSFSQGFCPSTDRGRIFRRRCDVCKSVRQCVLPCNQGHAPHPHRFVPAITEEAFSELGAKRKGKPDCRFQANERRLLQVKCNSLFCYYKNDVCLISVSL